MARDTTYWLVGLTLLGVIPPSLADDGVAWRPDSSPAELEKRIVDAPAKRMAGAGIAGVTGGVHIRVLGADPQEVLLPVPQLTGGQVPLAYVIRTEPADAASEFRLRKRDDGNVVIVVRLKGEKQELRIRWAAAVLLTSHAITPDETLAEPYRKATACVQAGADEVTRLAAKTWPKPGKVAEFAANIQAHIRDMKRTERPRSLDAVGILASGENGICTANANLAAALMRAKGIACRSVAVVPPIGMQLEMHRVVEFEEGKTWVPFDPSGLTTDVPARPWQNVVMAKTTIADEEAAMKLRMGAMPGCPYGQEAELLSTGVMLFGNDFFWTKAIPLAEFDVPEEVAKSAAAAWKKTLESGKLSLDQAKAAAARSAKALDEALKAK